MDKHQELRTNLVLQADSALTAIRELSGRLNQISHIKFDNVKKGFDSLTKAFESAQKMSSKVAKAQVGELETLKQKQAKLMDDMAKEFSKKKSGLSVKVDMSEAQKELQKTTRMVADMYLALGDTSKARSAMKQVLSLLTTLDGAGFKNTGIKAFEREMASLERHIQQMDNKLKEIKRKTASGIAEEARQESLRKGENPFDNPVYANSEDGKRALKALQEKQKAEAQFLEEQAKGEKALQEHLRKMQSQPSLSEQFDKSIGLNENQINTPENKKRRKKQLEKAKSLTESSEENKREQNLQYDQKTRYALQKKMAQEAERQAREEEKAQKQALANAKAEAEAREKALRYEQQVRSAIAKQRYKDEQRQARLEAKNAENRKKLQDKIDDFQRKINFEKRPGNAISEAKFFALEQELIKIKRMADGIGATDISAKLNKKMLDGINVVTNAIKEQDKVKKQAESEEEKRLKSIGKYLNDIAKLWKSIESHKGANGLGYSVKGYNNEVNRIENLRNRALDLGLKGDASLLTPALLDGVNTKVSQFNNRLNEAKDRAQELYMRFRESRTEADRLNFLKAKNDLRELERLSEDFNRSIQKSNRSALSLGNILKRAKEHFNWTAGAYVENAIVSVPSTLIEDVSKFELAMAGVAQVLPKVEEGQGALNEQFKAFADTASRYGQNVDNVLEAAKSIGRMYGQGDGNADVGATNTQLLVAQAAKMATVDNFDMLQATKGLESALAQFNLQTEDTNLLMQRSSHILDVWTKLAHSSGASAQDLTEGMNKCGSAAHNAGLSFEMTNALIASGVRNTAESGNIIGNALKSMFSSVLSDKNIKNMERYGVQVYKIGKNGKKELREMQDIIMDISRILGNPSMDVKGLREFMMSISGGKQQYSRIEAILGHPEELERTLKLAQNSTGFANQQLAIQMDTVSRKWEALKANVAQMFFNSGADGFANDLKWILDCLNRLTHSLANSSNHIYKWAKYGTMMVVAWKAIPSLINMATRAIARYNVAKQAGNVAGGVSEGLFGGVRTDYQAEIDRQRKKKLTRAGVDLSEIKNTAELTAVWNQYTASVNKNTWAQRLNNQIANFNLNSTKAKLLGLIPTWNGVTGATQKVGASAKGMAGSFVSWIASLGRGTGAVRVLTTALGLLGSVGGMVFGVLRGAIAALGGPIGWAITAFTLLGSYLTSQAIDADLAKTANEELAQSVQDLTSEVGYEIEQMEEQKEKGKELAEQYNKLVDTLNELQQADDGSTESAQRQNEVREQMKQISDELAGVLHTNAIQFDEDGKINLATIDTLAEASHSEAMQKIDDTQQKVSAEMYATSVALDASKARIKTLEAELNTTSVASAGYRALYRVITWVKEAMVGLNQLTLGVLNGGITGWLLDGVFGKHVVDGWRDWAKSNYEEGMKEVRFREAELADPTNLLARHNIREELDKVDSLQKSWDEGNDNWNSLEAIKLGKSYNKATHEYEERKKINPTTENPNEGKWHPKSADDERAEKKAQKEAERAAKKAEREAKKAEREANKKRPYVYDDEESKAFSTASKHINQSYSSMGVDTPTLQAIASALNGGNFKGVADPFHNGASNAWDSTYNFAEQLKTQFQSGQSLKTALDEIFTGWGVAWDDVIQGQADALRKKYNYKMNERYFKDPNEPSGAGAGSVSNTDLNNALQKGVDTWLGQTMDLHGVGCVEAVEKIGSFYSKFLCDEFNAGVRYIPTLMEDAAKAGIKTLQYDASQLEIGDLIVWANDGDTQNHIGVYKGNGMAVDNSSGQDRIVERAVDRSWQRNEFIIKTGSGGGGGTPPSRWQRGGDGLDAFELNPVTERFNLFKQAMESIQNEQKRLEIEEKLTGNIADVSLRATKNMETMLKSTEEVNEIWKQYKDHYQNQIIDYLAKHPAVGDKVGGADKFFGISDEAQKELAKASKDKDFEKAVNGFITAKKNFEQTSNDLAQKNYDVRRQHGFLTDNEKYNNRIHQLDRLLDVEHIAREDKLELLQQKYAETSAEMARLDKEYAKLAIGNQEAIDEAKEELARKELDRKKIIAKYDLEIAKLETLDEKKKTQELENINKKKMGELKVLDGQIKEKRDEISDRSNGDAKMQEIKKQRDELEDSQKGLKKQIGDTEEAFRKAGANVSYNFFDKLLLQGQSFKECLKDITDEIAKIALKNIFYSMFGVKKDPLEEQGDIGMLLAGIGRKRKKRAGGGLGAVADVAESALGGGGLFGGAFGGRQNMAMRFPVNFGFNPGSVFQGLMQPMQQMTQGMTALTTGLGTANATMGMVNTTNQVLNTTNQLTNTTNALGRVATLSHTTATHSDAAAERSNTQALYQLNTTMQTQASMAGVSGASGGSGLGQGLGILSGLLGFLSTGGKIPAYATGGFTDGVISGAGTGTSDSILTYLAHRGQFIATSNGEYIIQKKAVDTLGVGFLDMLNNNPEAIGAMKGLKRYANGGNLGVSYSPSMTMKGIEGYQSFNKANMDKQTHFSTRRTEELLQGLREDVQQGQKGENTVAQPIILNTQADSASVMKAIAKNPRALQAIMGKQNKRGFR